MIKMENMRNFGEFFKITFASTPFGNDFFSRQFHLELTFFAQMEKSTFLHKQEKILR